MSTGFVWEGKGKCGLFLFSSVMKMRYVECCLSYAYIRDVHLS